MRDELDRRGQMAIMARTAPYPGEELRVEAC
jgi:hypothetical protein